MRFKVVLTCVLYKICVNARLLGMRVQNKRMYVFKAVYMMKIVMRVLPFTTVNTSPKRSGCRLSRLARIKQSGCTISGQTRLKEVATVAVHFPGMYSIINKAAVRFLGILDQNLTAVRFLSVNGSIRSHLS